MQAIICLVILACVWAGCAVERTSPELLPTFSEVPPEPAKPPPAPPPTPPQPVDADVREKIVSIYQTTYWAQIYPQIRDVRYLRDLDEYEAHFFRSREPLSRQFPRKDIRFTYVQVTFDGQLRLKRIGGVIVD